MTNDKRVLRPSRVARVPSPPCAPGLKFCTFCHCGSRTPCPHTLLCLAPSFPALGLRPAAALDPRVQQRSRCARQVLDTAQRGSQAPWCSQCRRSVPVASGTAEGRAAAHHRRTVLRGAGEAGKVETASPSGVQAGASAAPERPWLPELVSAPALPALHTQVPPGPTLIPQWERGLKEPAQACRRAACLLCATT